MKILIGLALLGIVGVLGSALVFLIRDKSGTSRMVNALTLRVALSAALILFIWFSYWMGWIEPRVY